MERSKKECVLEAAVKAFARFGFRKTSIDEIARDAKVAKGTVYLCCESKEDLFYQAVHREVRGWVAEISKLIDPRKRADELLLEIGQASLTLMGRRPLVKDLLVGILNGQLPEWADRIEELRGLGRTNVEEVLRLGVRQGIFTPSLDVEAVAPILQDLQVHGYLRFIKDGGRPEDLARALAAGRDLVPERAPDPGPHSQGLAGPPKRAGGGGSRASTNDQKTKTVSQASQSAAVKGATP